MRFMIPNLKKSQHESKSRNCLNRTLCISMGLAILATLSVGLTVTAGSGSRGRGDEIVSVVQSSPDPIEPQLNASSVLKPLPIQLKFEGFFPSEIRRPAGSYYLTVGNVSREKDIRLRLDRLGGGRLFDVELPRQKPLRQTVLLAPGAYVLTEANHPRWVCRITVTAP